jgi:hypothetical protein
MTEARNSPTQAMPGMHKIDIAGLEAAYHGQMTSSKQARRR